MEFIDTHTHLYLEEFSSDIHELIQRAEEEGVIKFFLPAIDSSHTVAIIKLEETFPGKCMPMTGLHPCSVKENYKEELAKIEKLLEDRKFYAIGESGLDFYWDTTFTKQQYDSLHIHAVLALKYNLPLILHTRNAMEQTIEVIKSFKGKGLRGIFHCFGGTPENAHDIIDQDFFLGIGGVITYKNSGLAETIKDIDLKYLVLETDAPYLAPVPFRGKRNESSYIKYVAQKLADIKNVSIEEIARQTTINARDIFGN